jgi:hypothetical protein
MDINKIFPVFIFLIFIFLSKCDTTEPPDKGTLTLTLEDASCTEAWLTLNTENLQLPAGINIKRTDADGNSVSHISILSTQDSLLYIDSLLPNKTYTFKADLSSIQNPVSSNEITVTTMDTTSHNFTWQSWTFGEVGSSVLYDVAVIDENNIWAVGEINIADTSVNGYTTYNAVHWDGNEWSLKRIFFPTVCGSSNLTSYPAKAIFVFGDGKIWISSSGDKIAILENGIQINQFCLASNVSMSINKIWGKNSSDLYVVGNNGNIAHYNGSPAAAGWTRIESGTSLHIYDIWGEQNENGEYEILCVAAEHFVGPERKILSIKNNFVQEISTSNISIGSFYGVWFKTDRKYFVVGNGIYTKQNIANTDNWIALHNNLTPYYAYSIRGTAYNNIFICGSFGESLFFNGSSWTTFRNTPGFYDAEFYKADIKENIIVAAGYSGSKGFIAIGKR